MRCETVLTANVGVEIREVRISRPEPVGVVLRRKREDPNGNEVLVCVVCLPASKRRAAAAGSVKPVCARPGIRGSLAAASRDFKSIAVLTRQVIVPAKRNRNITEHEDNHALGLVGIAVMRYDLFACEREHWKARKDGTKVSGERPRVGERESMAWRTRMARLGGGRRARAPRAAA